MWLWKPRGRKVVRQGGQSHGAPFRACRFGGIGFRAIPRGSGTGSMGGEG
ncbi:MAG: hypothetical protein RMI90_08905 [Thermoguttaceae bacterium]|nr:hypothetical protein [Thermoguttaceae bacterium]